MPNQTPSNRKTIRQRILDFFADNLGQEYKSNYLHEVFGSAFRTRASEINRDTGSPIVVRNRVTRNIDVEHSVYWAELNALSGGL